MTDNQIHLFLCYVFRSQKHYKIDDGILTDLNFPRLRFKNVKEVDHIKEFGPSEENVFFWIGYPYLGTIHILRKHLYGQQTLVFAHET